MQIRFSCSCAESTALSAMKCPVNKPVKNTGIPYRYSQLGFVSRYPLDNHGSQPSVRLITALVRHSLLKACPRCRRFRRQFVAEMCECRRIRRLSLKSATVEENGDCRRKVRMSPNSTTVAIICDSRRFGDSVDRA